MVNPSLGNRRVFLFMSINVIQPHVQNADKARVGRVLIYICYSADQGLCWPTTGAKFAWCDLVLLHDAPPWGRDLKTWQASSRSL